MKTGLIKTVSAIALSLSAAFAQADERDSTIEALHVDVTALARKVIHDTAREQPDPASVQGRIEALIAFDHTVLYGNNIALLGVDANHVLRSHYSVPDRLKNCDGSETPLQKMDIIGNCLGNIQELSNFGLAVVDEKELESLRYRYVALKP